MTERTVLITGASRGIGRAILERFNQSNFRLIGTATSEKGLDAIRSCGDNVIAKQLDLSDKSSIEDLLGSLRQEDMFPDTLINNAGVTADNLMLRMKDSEWDSVIETNLTGVFSLTQGLLKPMVKNRFGRIVTISSVVGFTGNAGQANYAAAKAGLVGFNKSLAQEIATRGITANIVAPGFIETDMTSQLNETQKESLAKNIPMQRMGTASDIAEGVFFLCSEKASYITGHTLHINGGMFMS